VACEIMVFKLDHVFEYCGVGLSEVFLREVDFLVFRELRKAVNKLN
jgi:hypothetical protein